MGSYGEVPIAFNHNKVFQPFSPHLPLKNDYKIPPGMAIPTLLQVTCSNAWPPLSMKNFFLISSLNLPRCDLRPFPCVLSLATCKKKKQHSPHCSLLSGSYREPWDLPSNFSILNRPMTDLDPCWDLFLQGPVQFCQIRSWWARASHQGYLELVIPNICQPTYDVDNHELFENFCTCKSSKVISVIIFMSPQWTARFYLYLSSVPCKPFSSRFP